MSNELNKREEFWQIFFRDSIARDDTADMAKATADTALKAFDEAFVDISDESALGKLLEMEPVGNMYVSPFARIEFGFKCRDDLDAAMKYFTELGFKGTWQ